MKNALLISLIIGVFSLSCNTETNCLTKEDLPKRECLTKSELPETVTCDLAKNCLTQNELAQIVSCKEKLADPTKNELAADRAFEEGTKLLNAGKFDEAKIYFVNAINHDPNEINYYKKLFETMKKMKLDSEDLAELKTVFELGIYRVDSRNIKELNENILPEIERQITEKIAANEKAESAAESSETVDIKKELSDLEKGELSFARLLKKLDKEKIEERLTQLAAMKENAESNDALDAACEKTKILLQYAIIIDTVDQYLETSEDLLNKNDEKFFPSIESILQNAKVTLSQAWAIDFDKLNDGKSDPLAEINKYAQQIDDKIKLFGKKKSEPVMRKIRQLAEQTKLEDKKIREDKSIENPNTMLLNNLQKEINEIPKLLSAIYDDELRGKVEEHIRLTTTYIRNIEKNRLKAYQHWAAKEILAAINIYNDSRNNDNAKTAARILEPIDVKLLIPEISTMYSKALEQFLGEFSTVAGWDDKRDMQAGIALSYKKPLEDF